MQRSSTNRTVLLIIVAAGTLVFAAAQTRKRPGARIPATQQAPRGSAAKYSVFQHSSDKHKSLTCNACHKIPTAWTANRAFPDVADFPDHEACVRCHRRQLFTREAFAGTGPVICTVCHIRSTPREEQRYAFGKPNSGNQRTKPKDERQFRIEFPHDKHQNVIARLRNVNDAQFVRTSFVLSISPDAQKADYNNCSICHQRNTNLRAGTNDADTLYPFKTTPLGHDACFGCHWKAQEPAGDKCAGCHKASEEFVALEAPKRISAKFAHEGGKGEHVLECTSCHINITRASTSRGLTPDVPIYACASCHRDSKKTTYPKAVTIETELEQFKKTSNCIYCHTVEVGQKKPPPSHDSAVQ